MLVATGVVPSVTAVVPLPSVVNSVTIVVGAFVVVATEVGFSVDDISVTVGGAVVVGVVVASVVVAIGKEKTFVQ